MRIPVLIVGGGYAGLATSLFLSHHGIRSLLVDRHPGVSVQGRARGINQRTMEIYRPLGLQRPIEDAGRVFDDDAGVARCAHLTDEWLWVYEQEAPRAWPDLTAGAFCMADQNTVEPILIEAARRHGGDIRHNTRMLSFDATDDGVTALVEGIGEVNADYLVAADGHRSPIREQIGITRQGAGITQHLASITVDADLSGIVTRRALFWIVVNDDIGFGAFVTTATPNRWGVSVAYDPATESLADFTEERCVRVARSVIGADVPVRVVDVAGWQQAVGVADAYRAGRVFLVGDSAHVWPPAGAMGANSAVQDAHNLAWKLAHVLRGKANPSLLDTYEAERRPVALELSRITVARQAARWGDDPERDDVDDVLCTLGQRYRSTAVVGARHDTVFGDTMDTGAAPGTRAPHVWLDPDTAVHDLCHDEFVLLSASAAWCAAADDIARAVRCDVDGDWGKRYRAGEDDAILLRPDGYVAWRHEGLPADPRATLVNALDDILGRSSK
ncbi:MAG TPA: FAD-dependent monooxygenase [Pseudonocardiaceae bacterium]|jgi:2-polyprenyl-6-methoxyphenol hydroxylase-like FAD-dependent oxidoreductase|nr:FAD-dependent monooxygenase [Pseudonocardiaceae bacterium]